MIHPADHTFVICAYKESPYLERCIRSVLRQSVKSRVIIATSTDNSYIRSLASRYHLPLFTNDRPSDIAGDWNFACACADTAYVTLTHQDDIYDREYLAQVLFHLACADHPQICFTDYYEIRGTRRINGNPNLRIKRLLLSPLRISSLRNSIFIKRAVLSLGNSICCPSVTFVKQNIPEQPFTSGMKSNVDWQAWESLSAQKGSFVYVPQKLMGHRIHEGSATSELIGDHTRSSEDLFMLEKFWPQPVAALICRFYRHAEDSNSSSEKQHL